jgi:hypothetical protein
VLPVATVENLALRSQTGHFFIGEDIIVQGEAAEGFYVIEEGTVDVYVDGLLRREQGPGEYFGEIALLRGGVRTATVRATTPVAVVAVARNDFLESIGSHARSTHVAETASWPSGSPRRPRCRSQAGCAGRRRERVALLWVGSGRSVRALAVALRVVRSVREVSRQVAAIRVWLSFGAPNVLNRGGSFRSP